MPTDCLLIALADLLSYLIDAMWTQGVTKGAWSVDDGYVEGLGDSLRQVSTPLIAP